MLTSLALSVPCSGLFQVLEARKLILRTQHPFRNAGLQELVRPYSWVVGAGQARRGDQLEAHPISSDQVAFG